MQCNGFLQLDQFSLTTWVNHSFCRQIVWVLDHFVGLALKGLIFCTFILQCPQWIKYSSDWRYKLKTNNENISHWVCWKDSGKWCTCFLIVLLKCCMIFRSADDDTNTVNLAVIKQLIHDITWKKMIYFNYPALIPWKTLLVSCHTESKI